MKTLVEVTTLNPKFFPFDEDDIYEMFGVDKQAIYDLLEDEEY